MTTYKIRGKADDFTIKSIEDISHLEALCALNTKIEPNIYHMERVIAGTRKKPQTIMCWRVAGTNQFVSVL